ncbi:MAG: PIN domain-containing protein [Bacteroidia bacterium]|nr:PIN domain-containing protein [Bacteroidia bacterium]
MREYVLDANILMSMLMSGKADYRPLLSFFTFILPEFVLVEVEKYSEVIKQKSRLSDTELLQWTYFVFSQLAILPRYALQQESLAKAEELLRNVDLKDVPYVALSMQVDLPLLTRDKLLYDGLRKQGFRKVQLFEDFLKNI